MLYKLEGSIIPPPGTDTTVACDFEISETSSKLPAFFLRKINCTPAQMQMFVFVSFHETLNSKKIIMDYQGYNSQ